ncbi:hypothetical protein [Pseudomonas sp. S36]|uniref:hypothetical protein n=1 Tax=Pseudomonas sp. S36 TaxID=2767447 RepID=UPI001911DB50|nr:hypothetical protein [Pseudomonas sp. S36]MBK4987427.1 hypothetical protein [Pseudomonas sp. S36]
MEPNEIVKPDPTIADSTAGEPAVAGRSYAGILVHHETMSYHAHDTYGVTLRTPAGHQVLHSVGLQQALRDTPIQPGKPVLLISEANGDEPVWRAIAIDEAALEAFNANRSAPQAAATGTPAPKSHPAQPSGEASQSALDAIMEVAAHVRQASAKLNPEEVKRINASLHEQDLSAPSKPERAPNAAESLVKGTAELAGGVASLTGAAMQGLGKGANALAGALRGGNAEASKTDLAAEAGAGDELSGRVPVLPRLSEYRVDQVEKAANNYHKAHEAFWAADKMPEVRQEIESRATETGLTVPEVIEKMKPDGEFNELHESFVNAVGQSADAQNNKKSMDKALTGWARQYGRAQEELLNPETEGNPHYEKLKGRLEASSQNMHSDAAKTPAFAGETQSHLERLKEVMARISERLKEMLKGIVDLVRGVAPGGSRDNDFAP